MRRMMRTMVIISPALYAIGVPSVTKSIYSTKAYPQEIKNIPFIPRVPQATMMPIPMRR